MYSVHSVYQNDTMYLSQTELDYSDLVTIVYY